jgi:hypothetical protein
MQLWKRQEKTKEKKTYATQEEEKKYQEKEELCNSGGEKETREKNPTYATQEDKRNKKRRRSIGRSVQWKEEAPGTQKSVSQSVSQSVPTIERKEKTKP